VAQKRRSTKDEQEVAEEGAAQKSQGILATQKVERVKEKKKGSPFFTRYPSKG
jgi:hypothetical protein